MASETRFKVTCGGEQHVVRITTVHIPDPDHPKSGKTIPAPHLEMPSHCTCPDHEHCCGDSEQCDGQRWLESQMVYLKLADHAEPSCAQWCLEFMGTASKRVAQSWWSIVTAEKAAAK